MKKVHPIASEDTKYNGKVNGLIGFRPKTKTNLSLAVKGAWR